MHTDNWNEKTNPHFKVAIAFGGMLIWLHYRLFKN